MTHGTIAGILISDLIAGRENRWASLYDPSRIRVRAAADFAKENLNVAAQFKDYLTGGDVDAGPQSCPRLVERHRRPGDSAGPQFAERRASGADEEAADDRLLHAVAAAPGLQRRGPRKAHDADVRRAGLVFGDPERGLRPVGERHPHAAQVARPRERPGGAGGDGEREPGAARGHESRGEGGGSGARGGESPVTRAGQ